MTSGLPFSVTELHRLAVESVCVCDDDCGVETEGGVEDKQRKRERKRQSRSFTAIFQLKAKEEGVDRVPGSINGRNTYS